MRYIIFQYDTAEINRFRCNTGNILVALLKVYNLKKKLQEIDRIVEYTSRLKQELSLDEGGVSYWKATESNIGKISEMMNHLNKFLHK